MCLYPQCLETKFVVFGSSIDLVGHEVEAHSGNTSGLQRCMQTEARRVELNFQYESFRPARDNESRKTNNNSNNNNSSSSRSSSSSSRNTPPSTTDFPSIQSTAASSARVVPGAPTRKKGKQKAIQRPTGFGDLSDRESSSSGTVTPDTAINNASPMAAAHAAFLAKLEGMLQKREQSMQTPT
ncbi:hypothetical protein G6F56_011950 [Rhizopus delemar]|nr:hypothetical protein G6F56_011950 [Rhizopus delemar]